MSVIETPASFASYNIFQIVGYDTDKTDVIFNVGLIPSEFVVFIIAELFFDVSVGVSGMHANA